MVVELCIEVEPSGCRPDGGLFRVAGGQFLPGAYGSVLLFEELAEWRRAFGGCTLAGFVKCPGGYDPLAAVKMPLPPFTRSPVCHSVWVG